LIRWNIEFNRGKPALSCFAFNDCEVWHGCCDDLLVTQAMLKNNANETPCSIQKSIELKLCGGKL
jgi:hypothetical protein